MTDNRNGVLGIERRAGELAPGGAYTEGPDRHKSRPFQAQASAASPLDADVCLPWLAAAR
jgi:hypothetical protein